MSAILHKHGRIALRAVLANGGGEPLARARLARCVLDHVGETRVPVGVGSAGTAAPAQPHEFDLAGYDAVDDARIELDGGALLLRALRRARAGSVTVVAISSLRDLADAVEAAPELVRAKVRTIGVMGGLRRDARAPHGWAPDSSQNNAFDETAAGAVYAWAMGAGVRLVVLGREAVPLLPMQLAKSFADRTECPVRAGRAACGAAHPARAS